MTVSPSNIIRLRLAQLSAHMVIALIALIVIGGSTRVMGAGLACPDWPLCFGSFLPGHQMNMQVFLEWFHRLDAFLVGLGLAFQLCLGIIFRSQLPRWLPWIFSLVVFLVLIQGALGALTVFDLLETTTVTAHLGMALLLVALMSGITQRLLSLNTTFLARWWRILGGISLLGVFGQCLLGGRMSTSWAVHKCLKLGNECRLFDSHLLSALPVAILILIFVFSGLALGGWPRSQWRFLFAICSLLIAQILLGILSVKFLLHQPIFTIAHQLCAALLVAFLSALICRTPNSSSLNSIEMQSKSVMAFSNG